MKSMKKILKEINNGNLEAREALELAVGKKIIDMSDEELKLGLCLITIYQDRWAGGKEAAQNGV